MHVKALRSVLLCACLAGITLVVSGALLVKAQGQGGSRASYDAVVEQNVRDGLAEGRRIFRHDTFGDEDFWGGGLKLHNAIQGSRFGGVGSGISPRTALSLGLKVDAEALPAGVRNDLRRGRVNLDDPATTLALLRANAVVGVQGFFTQDGRRLRSVGITCAICHSRVDDSFAPGIGRRLDGWPNQDLNVGAIIAASPDLSPLTNLLRIDRATSNPKRLAGVVRGANHPGSLAKPILARVGQGQSRSHKRIALTPALPEVIGAGFPHAGEGAPGHSHGLPARGWTGILVVWRAGTGAQ